MGVDTVFATMNPIHKITKADGLSVYLTGPYQSFRNAILDALRSGEPMVTIEIQEGVAVTVVPDRVSAPDVIKIVVERREGGGSAGQFVGAYAHDHAKGREGCTPFAHGSVSVLSICAWQRGDGDGDPRVRPELSAAIHV